MKKLVLFAAVIVAVSFVSCKQKAAPEPVVPAADTTAVVKTPTDTTVAVAVQEAK